MEALVLILLVGVVWSLLRSGTDRAALNLLIGRVESLEARVAPTATPTATPAPAPLPAPPASSPATPVPHVPAMPRMSRPIGARLGEEHAPSLPVATFAERAHESVPRQRTKLERIVAEHTLALVGGAFVLVAAVLFVTFAIDQGWIGPWLRFALTLAFAAALVGAGRAVAQRLPEAERTGRAIGSLHGVLVGTGIAIAFMAIVAAVRLEGLLSASAGAVLEALVAVAAVLIARRWRSQDLAAFGVCVGIAAPILVAAPATGSTIALLVSTLVAAAVLAAWEQWPRLWFAAVLISAPQVVSYAPASSTSIAAVVFAWWLLVLAGCMGCALRDERGARRSIVATVFVATPVVAGRLFDLYSVAPTADESRRAAALAILAALHVGAAVVLLTRAHLRERAAALAIALLGAGATVAAIAIGDAAGDVARVAGWAFEAVALGFAAAHLRSRVTAGFAGAAALLAIGHVLALDAPPELLWSPTSMLGRPLGALVVILIAAGAARLVLSRAPEFGEDARQYVRRALDTILGVAAWYCTAVAMSSALDTTPGSDLVIAAWAAIGAVACVVAAGPANRPEWLTLAGIGFLVEAGRIEPERYVDAEALWVLAPVVALTCGMAIRRGGRIGWFAILAMASAHWVLVLVTALIRVPPSTIRVGDAVPVAGAAVVLVVLVAATLLLARAVEAWDVAPDDLHVARATWIARALVAWYAISALVVTALTSTPGAVEQVPQLALTLTWVAIGIAALLAGTSHRLRRFRELRLGGYALLGVAAAKLVLIDTAEFETPTRVIAFLATGLGLLGSAALEQRMRSADDPSA